MEDMKAITIQEIDKMFEDDDKTLLEEIAGMHFVNEKNRKLFIELIIKGEEGKLKDLKL